MKTLLIAAVIATALPATSALAQADGRFAVGAQVGTPGAGLQAQFALSPVVVLRGGYDVLKWDRNQTYKGIDYDPRSTSSRRAPLWTCIRSATAF
jgi:hypothetical protein